jgi:glycolate oxidase
MSLSLQWIEKAKEIVGEAYILTNSDDLEPYSHDELAIDSYNRLPEALVRPATEEEIAEIVKLCGALKVPLTVRGGGTGLSAACVPSPGVVLVDRFNKLIDADENNHTITVQAGMPLHNLYKEVDKIGLYFPPHPGDEGAFVGGVVATNAGGARAVKYGTVKRFVLGLRVILADGSIIDLGGKFIKLSSGYDLLNLMISSEGTLGIITRVTFSLLPRPGAVATIVVPFKSVAHAVDTVPALLKANVIPAAVEFVEHSVMLCVEKLLNRKWPAQDGEASLMIILDGRDEDDVMTQAEQLSDIVENRGALDVLLAESKEKQAEILQMRSSLYEALRPGVAEIFDITVPRSEIAHHIRFIHDLEKKFDIILPTYGHAADGNVHSHYMRRALKDGIIGDELLDWKEKHKEVRTLLFEDALKRGGNISGEHGIGLAKKEVLEQTLGEAKLKVMKNIKRALDPANILNPGKVVDV